MYFHIIVPHTYYYSSPNLPGTQIPHIYRTHKPFNGELVTSWAITRHLKD